MMASQRGCVQLAFIIFSFIKINAVRSIKKKYAFALLNLYIIWSEKYVE